MVLETNNFRRAILLWLEWLISIFTFPLYHRIDKRFTTNNRIKLRIIFFINFTIF